MIRLGHIEYSNCLPVHAPLLTGDVPAAIRIVRGVPTRLNEDLSAGRIDVAPCSSIEYARHADRYRILPGLAIGSCGAVGSIVVESTVPLAALHGREIAVPTASATSIVLLRILLEQRYGVAARLVPFAQETGPDPIDDGAAAALRIGDPALVRASPAGRQHHDLGALWTEWTGLPFAYAVWQTPLGENRDDELATLHAALLRARAYFVAHVREYATRYASQLMPADRLLTYWQSLRYALDAPMRAGLRRFFDAASELGEAPRIGALRFTATARGGEFRESVSRG
jgi:chorismate dehydratase